jgi:hypothetical protein
MTILVVILILLLIGAFPAWPYSRSWGYYPSGLKLSLSENLRAEIAPVPGANEKVRSSYQCAAMAAPSLFCSGVK